MIPQAGTKSCLRFEAHGKDKVFALTILESTNSNVVKITFVLQGPIYMDKRIKNVQLSCFSSCRYTSLPMVTNSWLNVSTKYIPAKPTSVMKE